MTAKPKVLVLPEWYPTAANPITGSFFQEQAAALSGCFDMRVLKGFSHPFGFRSLRRLGRERLDRRGQPLPWGQVAAALTGRVQVRPLDAGFVPEPPPAAAFEFYHRSPDEPARLRAECEAHLAMLGRLSAGGWKPDLVHAQCTATAGVVAESIQRALGVPFVLAEHQVFTFRGCSLFMQERMLRALHCASRVVAVSRHQLRCLLQHGIHRPIEVVGNLVDESVFQLAPARPAQPKPFRLLTVTYPDPVKDCATFFAALGELARRGHRDIEATIIGNNSWDDAARAGTEYYQAQARQHGVEEMCRYQPSLPRRQMPEAYSQCDVFVSTSVVETFGVAVREALCVGRPVVATASGGVEDILGPETGLKVPVRDPAALAEAILRIKTGRVRFDGAVLRRHAVEQHGRDAFIRQMSRLYEEVLQESARPAGRR